MHFCLFTDFKEEYEILSDITVLHIFLFFLDKESSAQKNNFNRSI